MRTEEEKRRRKAYLNYLRQQQRIQNDEVKRRKDEYDRVHNALLDHVDRWLAYVPSEEKEVLIEFLKVRQMWQATKLAYTWYLKEDHRVLAGGAVPDEWNEQT